jgi:hypothetical protein
MGFILSFFILAGCSTSRLSIDKSILAGHWITSKPEEIPNVIIDSKQNFLLLLEDNTSSDTLCFTYSLKRNVLTLYNGKLWISKNSITKLSADSLIYVRKGDKEIFYYSRKKVDTNSLIQTR